MSPQNTRAYRGRTAIVLALGVAISAVAISAAIAISSHAGSEMDAATAALLSTVLGAVVGALATYLGGSVKQSDSGDDELPLGRHAERLDNGQYSQDDTL